MPKGEFLGETVIAIIGTGPYSARQKRAFVLEEHELESDTYTGVTHVQDNEFTKTFEHIGKGIMVEGRTANVAVALRISGMKRYPDPQNRDAAFQFVLRGEDVTPLEDIAARNAQKQEQGGDAVIEDRQDEQAVDNRPTWQKKGFTSKQEWKSAGSPE